MKLYAKVSSIEKKEIVRENADGKKEKKIVHVLKAGTVDGVRVTLKSDEPKDFREFPVGSVIAASLTSSQRKLDEEPGGETGG